MKRFFYVFAIAFMAVFSLSLVSCDKNDDPEPPKKSLVGSWKLISGGSENYTCYIRLNGNGEFMQADLDEREFDIMNGKWKFENDKLIVTTKPSNNEPAETFEAKIQNLTKDSFAMVFYDEKEKKEEVLKFVRVTDKEMNDFIAKNKQKEKK